MTEWSAGTTEVVLGTARVLLRTTKTRLGNVGLPQRQSGLRTHTDTSLCLAAGPTHLSSGRKKSRGAWNMVGGMDETERERERADVGEERD